MSLRCHVPDIVCLPFCWHTFPQESYLVMCIEKAFPSTATKDETMDLDQFLAHLQSSLQPSDLQAQLIIDRSTCNSMRLHHLLDTYYGGTALVIDQASIQPPKDGESTIMVNGLASFPLLHLPAVPVRVTFFPAQDGIDVTLEYQLPATWTFSQSFPSLPLSWNQETASGFSLPVAASDSTETATGEAVATVQEAVETSVAAKPLLDLLSYTNACFVVSTIPTVVEIYQTQMQAGLSFVSHLKLGGILGGIEKTLCVPEPLTLSGPILLSPLPEVSAARSQIWSLARKSQPLPGINLKAEAQVDLSIGQVRLKDAYVRFYSPLDAATQLFSPGIFLGGDLQIGEQITVEVVAEKSLCDDHSLILTGTFEGVELPSLSHLASLVGADDLTTHLTPPSVVPAFLSPERTLSIRGVSMSLSCDPFSVDGVGIWLGLDGPPWNPIDTILEVDELMIRVWVDAPFSSARSLQATLIGNMKVEEVPLLISASAPDFLFIGCSLAPSEIPLQTLLSNHLPDLTFTNDLVVKSFFVSVQPGQAYSFAVELADQPHPFTIELGPETLTVSNLQLLLNYAQGGGFSGALNANLSLAGVQLQVTYQSPGSLSLRGQLPTISLKQLVTTLCGTSQVWPSSFDLILSESMVILEKQPSGFVLMLGTQVASYGCLALQISCQNDIWGFAAGIDLDYQWKLSSISPDLSIFDNNFQFKKTMLVFSSIQAPTFSFPDMAAFNDPALTSSRITLPATVPGIAKGFNIYAQVTISEHKALQLCKKMLQLNQTTLDVMVQIGENSSNATLTTGIQGTLNSATAFNGSLRVISQGGALAFSLLGNAVLTVHNQPLSLGGEIDVTEEGAYGSLTMRGQWTDAFEVRGLTLSDVALEVGADWDGIPTIGLAATLDYRGNHGSVAILLDSVEPSKSMLAGSISDLALSDVVKSFLVGKSDALPPELQMVANAIKLLGVPLFTLPAPMATALDSGSLPKGLVQAFASQGRINLPHDPKQVLVAVGRKGVSWSITDQTTLRHYEITRKGDQLQVSLPVQLSIVPQATRIGQMVFQQGFRLIGAARIVDMDASINIDVSQQNGLALSGTLKSVDLSPVFRLSGPGGKGDPQIELATYNAPGMHSSGPHCILRGAVSMLGMTRDLDLRATKEGITLQTTTRIFNAFQASLSAVCPIEHFSKADFSVTATMDTELFNFLKTRGTAAINQAAITARSAISDAQNTVNDAQKQVNTLNDQIVATKALVQAEWDTLQRAFNDAQKKADGLQHQVDDAQHHLNNLLNDLGNLIKQVFQNPLDIQRKRDQAEKLKNDLSHLRSDLAAAKNQLEACRQALPTISLEDEPRVAQVISDCKNATDNLQADTANLWQIQQANSLMAGVADWIIQHGSDQFLTVTHASFSGRLGAVSSAKASMQIDLSVMGHSHQITQDFNFNDLENTASAFVEQVKQLISLDSVPNTLSGLMSSTTAAVSGAFGALSDKLGGRQLPRL